MTPADLYGTLFNYLADEIADARIRALEFMTQAQELGLDPAEMGCDYALIELGLADESNTTNLDGTPVVEYRDLVGGMIEDDCCEDCEDEDY